MPGKSAIFTPSSILFRPQQKPQQMSRSGSAICGGGAGYRPRVRMVYFIGHLSP